MKKQLNIGLAGLGTVGQALVQILQSREERLTLRTGVELVIKGVNARNKDKKRDCDISTFEWFDDPVVLAQSPKIDVYVELIGGEDGAALESVTSALKAGKAVVTANKALVAKHGMALAKLAEQHNASLYFEAAVAGGIPVIKTLRESLAGNRIYKVYGILNGTCNYILTEMTENGSDFASVLKDAQTKGYAEADPTFDIEGLDTAHKLSIITALAFGTTLKSDMYCEGISALSAQDIEAAETLGYKIKLLGIAERTKKGVLQRVHPVMVPENTAISEVNDVLNAVMIEADAVQTLTLVGPGAGGLATASAVISDVIDVASNVKPFIFGRRTDDMVDEAPAKMSDHVGSYYLRLNIQDKPGAFARIAQAMADHDISFKTVHQSGHQNTETQSVTIITHPTVEYKIQGVIGALKSAEAIAGDTSLIRIESPF